MIRFWQTWSVFVLMVIASYAGYYYGAIDFIYNNDFTYISIVNLSILYLFTLVNLYKSYYQVNEASDNQWFMSDAVLSLGMVGTLSGFLVVLYSTFEGLDPSNTESMKKAIETLASGMGTALLTSLVGLVSSIIMKYQLVVLES